MNREKIINNINELIDDFKRARRMGIEKDDPEGTRYITISDTMATIIVSFLTGVKDYLEENCK